MSQYRTFTAQDAVEYARQFGGLDDPSSLVEAQEIGDGNLYTYPVSRVYSISVNVGF